VALAPDAAIFVAIRFWKGSDIMPEPERGEASPPRSTADLLDLLGRRWALRVLWALRTDALSFRALQSACDALSPSVLNQRLRELIRAQLVIRTADGYALTQRARGLVAILAPLESWAVEWAAAQSPARANRPARRKRV
jgi:DNA-binding HxlR family transcriptional regulator